MKTIIIEQLEFMGRGLHYCGWFKGWITIEKRIVCYDVLWCNGKTSHQPLDGPAISVEFKLDGSVGFITKSILSMHEVTGKDNKAYCINFMIKKIGQAYRRRKLWELKKRYK